MAVERAVEMQLTPRSACETRVERLAHWVERLAEMLAETFLETRQILEVPLFRWTAIDKVFIFWVHHYICDYESVHVVKGDIRALCMKQRIAHTEVGASIV